MASAAQNHADRIRTKAGSDGLKKKVDIGPDKPQRRFVQQTQSVTLHYEMKARGSDKNSAIAQSFIAGATNRHPRVARQKFWYQTVVRWAKVSRYSNATVQATGQVLENSEERM